MKTVYWSVDFDSFDEKKDPQYFIEGWAFSVEGKPLNFDVICENGEKYEFDLVRKSRPDVVESLKELPVPPKAGFRVNVRNLIKKEESGCKKIILAMESDEKREIIWEKNIIDILRAYGKTTLQCNVDITEFRKGKMVIHGWVYSQGMEEKIEVLDDQGRPIFCKIKRVPRTDVGKGLHIDEDKDYGYEIYLDRNSITVPNIIVQISNRLTEKTFTINMKKFDFDNTKMGKYINTLGVSKFKENREFIKKFGIREFRYHVIKSMNRHIADYDIWAADHMTTPRELERQRKLHFEYSPLISIVIPLYNTPLQYLEELLNSILDQTYYNWQLCLADGSSNGEAENFIKNRYGQDQRILYRRLEKNEGISINTNAAFEMATGEFIMLSDHDDTVAPDALFEMVKALNENSSIDVIYTDEDKVTMDGKRYYDPHFKPDFNLDLLRSNNYICHIFVVRKTIVDQIGKLRHEYDGAQDYDFILRCCEKAREIHHIPKVLYHWRSHPASTAGNPESKMYAYEAGRAAVEAHYKRVGIPAKVTMTQHWGRYRSQLTVQGEPLVSILIPNKDHIQDLERCINSIYHKSSYKNFEILVIENNSEEKDTFQYYEQLEKTYDNLRVLKWDREFNYSAINNYGVKYANGEYLLFLNNDIEVKTDSWIEEMLGYCQREDVGAVGVKLLYEDEKIQHAGVVVGLGPSGTAGHVLYHVPNSEFVYAGKTHSTQDLSAVTAACMMTKKQIYQQVDGMDEDFRVAFNDIDYCLKVRECGKLVVYNAFAELYHHESVTRGHEDSPVNAKRFADETKRFKKKWADILKNGDPYYSPNLTKRKTDCSLEP